MANLKSALACLCNGFAVNLNVETSRPVTFPKSTRVQIPNSMTNQTAIPRASDILRLLPVPPKSFSRTEYCVCFPSCLIFKLFRSRKLFPPPGGLWKGKRSWKLTLSASPSGHKWEIYYLRILRNLNTKDVPLDCSESALLASDQPRRHHKQSNWKA